MNAQAKARPAKDREAAGLRAPGAALRCAAWGPRRLGIGIPDPAGGGGAGGDKAPPPPLRDPEGALVYLPVFVTRDKEGRKEGPSEGNSLGGKHRLSERFVTPHGTRERLPPGPPRPFRGSLP